MCLAVPGQLVDRFETDGLPMGHVDFNGVRRAVCLSCVPEAVVGDYVVVHVGFALSRMDAAEAERTLRLLDEMGEMASLDDGDGDGDGDGDVGRGETSR